MLTKYRPNKLSELFGNQSIKDSLNRLNKENKIPHGILLSGHYGCGKTTIAHIITKLLKSKHVVEVNCGATGGKARVLEIIERLPYQPLFGDTTIYIFDEAHKLTPDAQESLLTPVENASSYNYFIFCSNLPNKIKATLLNRLVKYNVTSLDNNTINNFIKNIVKKEQIEIDNETIKEIARKSKGIPRTALTMLVGLTDEELPYDDVEKEIIALPKLLFGGKVKWSEVVQLYTKILKKHTDDSIHFVTGKYFKGILKNSGGDKAYKLSILFATELVPPIDIKMMVILYKAWLINQKR